MSATPREPLVQKHYAALDVLRGVAAVLVVAHHFEHEAGDPQYFRHAFLAVDFFFVLSGFVVALAYEEKLRTGMGFWRFAKARFVRLYPMILAGALLGGAVAATFGSDTPLIPGLISQLTLIPGLAGGGALFLLNGPHWSLLLEIGGNLAHAASLRWLKTKVLAVGVLLAAVALAVVAFKFGHLSLGWSPTNWWGGLPRIAFSYGLGVLMYRLHALGALPRAPIPLPLNAALLTAALLGVSLLDSLWADLAFVMVVSPLVVLAGVTAPEGRSARTLGWLGRVSYPLYAIHMPLVIAWGHLAPITAWSAALALVLVTALSLAAERFYEQPARRVLGEWLRGRREARPRTV